MNRLLFPALAALLTGCASQIFLDGSPSGDTHIAGTAVEKRVYAISSDMCGRQEPVLPYQLVERSRDGWVRSCAQVEGFAFRPGNDYYLRVTEHRAAGESPLVRLILKSVIEQRPHTRN
ncbi:MULTISPECIES: hypothetical protein [unclassified Lysobacter]|uniref:DUF4377 domain-containing protein n=1 Tax=unclassified Lysobacter TaxID=2635362 RepID=UPI0006FA68EC|nr:MULTISPECIES: hypothetical protein [unclassified Lysobacter]KQZ60076.1 hypothetical protein ASD53_02640 [Lysobacter sp. Root559]KRA77050.1 hypothetical protein ASD78_05435 [Lysobacter sp. Root667]KRC38519.1 hypothetical protein ASE10_02965 [Lysobacter sp. Root76]KRD71284.1 hypothetical protein ASE45_05515 [Lysobacter sp. Root96]